MKTNKNKYLEWANSWADKTFYEPIENTDEDETVDYYDDFTNEEIIRDLLNAFCEDYGVKYELIRANFDNQYIYFYLFGDFFVERKEKNPIKKIKIQLKKELSDRKESIFSVEFDVFREKTENPSVIKQEIEIQEKQDYFIFESALYIVLNELIKARIFYDVTELDFINDINYKITEIERNEVKYVEEDEDDKIVPVVDEENTEDDSDDDFEYVEVDDTEFVNAANSTRAKYDKLIQKNKEKQNQQDSVKKQEIDKEIEKIETEEVEDVKNLNTEEQDILYTKKLNSAIVALLNNDAKKFDVFVSVKELDAVEEVAYFVIKGNGLDPRVYSVDVQIEWNESDDEEISYDVSFYYNFTNGRKEREHKQTYLLSRNSKDNSLDDVINIVFNDLKKRGILIKENTYVDIHGREYEIWNW